MRKLFKHGTVVNCASRRKAVYDVVVEEICDCTERADVLTQDDRIIAVKPEIEDNSAEQIDCEDLLLMPGLIDMHCHLRDPGFTHKGTLATEMRSAVEGGFTTICPMPNTDPVPDEPEGLKDIIARSKAIGLCNVMPYSSVTKGEKGEELVDFAEMLEAGALAFSDDGRPIMNAALAREAMIRTNQLHSFIAEHCEELSVAAGAINAGAVARDLGVGGVLPEAEALMAVRDVMLSAMNGCRTHICHVSSGYTIEMLRIAKDHGAMVSAETCPHYFTFTEEEVREKGTNAKMNPPLRTVADREEVIRGLADGTIDCIVTDHAPHARDEKAKSLAEAPNGIIGFETALSAAITELVAHNRLSYADLARLMSYNPARILGLDSRGVIAPGMTADITIVDPAAKYTYTEDMIKSKACNTPWLGKTLRGKVRYTVVSGRIVNQA